MSPQKYFKIKCERIVGVSWPPEVRALATCVIMIMTKLFNPKPYDVTQRLH